ncbi:MAG: hypothetical protein N2712_06630 [Brevinematales bacterium]|nr:hypothetical protein [Brevinematales bacterium]
MRKLFVTLLIVLLGGISFGQTLVYYDPDGNLRRIVDINSEGNRIFSKIGLKFFIAVDDNSFNSVVKQYSPEYFIMNSVIYQSRKRSLNLEAAFVFEKDKKTTYAKKIVTFQEGLGLKDIATRVLASSFRDISEIVPIEAKILKVPKDLDALLAMKFKQADFAIVSESSIDVFKTISPVDFGLLRVVYTSKEIVNPVFCFVQGKESPSKIREIQRLLVSSDAKQFMSLLLFDNISDDPKVLSKIR